MLVVIFSALLLILFGSGALLLRALLSAARPRAFTSLALGISLLHALTLTGLPLVAILAIVSALAAAELVLSWRRRRWVPSAADLRWAALIFATALPLWAFTMVRPLWAFDARNVWFFAGRIIYGAGRFPFDVWHRFLCHWGPDYRLNMNADYPKLIGSLTAAVATLAGYWNEYLPKISILLLHTLALIGLIELGWRWRAVVLNLLLTGISKYRYFFDSASLDIHVGFMTLIALLALMKVIDEHEQSPTGPPALDSLGMAVAALAIASQEKYEGRALAVIVLVGALVSRSVRWRELWRVRGPFLAFIPTALWLLEVRLFKVPSYLDHGRGAAAAIARIKAEYFPVIVTGIATEKQSVTGAVALGLALIAAKLGAPGLTFADLRRDPRIRLGLLTAFGYAFALSLVYVVSPYVTAAEQMQSSLSRATFPIEVTLLAMAMGVIEVAGRRRREGQAVLVARV